MTLTYLAYLDLATRCGSNLINRENWGEEARVTVIGDKSHLQWCVQVPDFSGKIENKVRTDNSCCVIFRMAERLKAPDSR